MVFLNLVVFSSWPKPASYTTHSTTLMSLPSHTLLYFVKSVARATPKKKRTAQYTTNLENSDSFSCSMSAVCFLLAASFALCADWRSSSSWPSLSVSSF